MVFTKIRRTNERTNERTIWILLLQTTTGLLLLASQPGSGLHLHLHHRVLLMIMSTTMNSSLTTSLLQLTPMMPTPSRTFPLWISRKTNVTRRVFCSSLGSVLTVILGLTTKATLYVTPVPMAPSLSLAMRATSISCNFAAVGFNTMDSDATDLTDDL